MPVSTGAPILRSSQPRPGAGRFGSMNFATMSVPSIMVSPAVSVGFTIFSPRQSVDQQRQRAADRKPLRQRDRDGFEVQSIDRFSVAYREGSQVVTVYVEREGVG